MNLFKRKMKKTIEEKKEETTEPKTEGKETPETTEGEETPTPESETKDEETEIIEPEKPEEKEKPEKTIIAEGNKAKKFIGFYRHGKEGAWMLFPKMLASEQSVINAITFEAGKVDKHIISIELP